ncbi:MAG: non-heme iron oxygenase ferredoxin subunit [Proteobacteria bacterium]|nr:MAG: non-heme iron oxygenase ferredoxin subunit [Pseudomonadota bacterium]
MPDWRYVANTDDIDEEDVIRVEVDGRVLAVYRLEDGFYATDGTCTHADACLSDGFVMDGFIECPLHQGRFEIRTGKAKSPPATEDLRTYELKIEDARILVRLD